MICVAAFCQRVQSLASLIAESRFRNPLGSLTVIKVNMGIDSGETH